MTTKKRQLNNAMIVFTREPAPGKTKTRLMPFYTPEQCAQLHLCFLKDLEKELRKIDADVFVSYTGGEPRLIRSVFGNDVTYMEQSDSGLGDRMLDAICSVKQRGYGKVVLFGSDIPAMRSESIRRAMAELETADVVLGATEDGGYYLIGMKEPCESAFSIEKYGNSTVFENTVRNIERAGCSVAFTDTYGDIDIPEDISEYIGKAVDDEKIRNTEAFRYVTENRKISIIVPTFNESSTICNMLDQLKEYRDDVEILIVDGSSTDNTTELIDDDWNVICCEQGRGHQLNIGAEHSTGDILFFLHCDSRLPADVPGEIRRCMRHCSYGCFGLKFDSRNLFMWTNRIISNHRAWRRGLPFGDQGIFIDRKLFFEMGGFPEIPFLEDYEFARQMRAAGYRPGKTERRIVASDRRYGKGTLGILRTEYEIWNIRRKYRSGEDPDLLKCEFDDKR